MRHRVEMECLVRALYYKKKYEITSFSYSNNNGMQKALCVYHEECIYDGYREYGELFNVRTEEN